MSLASLSLLVINAATQGLLASDDFMFEKLKYPLKNREQKAVC